MSSAPDGGRRKGVQRLVRWVGRVGAHGAAQLVSQAAAFATGILIVRELAKEDYATYSLSTWLVASVTLIAEAGISSLVLSSGQGLRDRPTALSQLFAAARRARILLGAGASLVGLGWLTTLYIANGVPLAQLLIVLAITGLTLIPTIAAGLPQGYHRIFLNTSRLRGSLWIPALIRLSGVALLASVGQLTLLTALGLAALVALFNLWWLSRGTRIGTGGEKPGRTSLFSTRVRLTASRVLPAMLALVVCEQIMFGVMSLRGSPEILAEYAALSRFGLVFALFSPIIADIVAPLIARLPAGSRDLKVAFSAVVGFYILLVAAMCGVVALLAPFLLWLLGPQYAGLDSALVIVFAASGVLSLGYALNVLSLARGWTAGSWVYIPLAAAWIAITLLVVPINSAQDAAWMYLSQVALWPTSQLARVAINGRRRGE